MGLGKMFNGQFQATGNLRRNHFMVCRFGSLTAGVT
jgi:hypothetical protein